MPGLIDFLFLYLCVKNGSKAKRKGLNGLLWGVLTAVAAMLAMVIGMMVVVFGFGADKITKAQLMSTDPKVRAANFVKMNELLAGNELHYLTVVLFGLGGYLLIRYILDQKPDIKKPEEKPSEYIS